MEKLKLSLLCMHTYIRTHTHAHIHKQDTYCSLLDSLDDGCGEGLLDLPSALPGLRRSAYLASQAQLNNLVRREREGGGGEGKQGSERGRGGGARGGWGGERGVEREEDGEVKEGWSERRMGR